MARLELTPWRLSFEGSFRCQLMPATSVLESEAVCALLASERQVPTSNTKKPKEVVVAVIDSGVDIEHEDLDGQVWTNPNEIAGNGVDDDNNGYIDDVHGWNFLGASNGDILRYESLEVTRMYRMYKQRFEGKTEGNIADADKEAFEDYQRVQKA